MTAQAWIPPETGLAHSDLPLWNMAMSHMNASMPLGDTGTSLRLSPIASPHLIGPLHALQSADGQVFYVHLDAFPYQELMGVDFDLTAARDIPKALADSIYAGSAEFLLQTFPNSLTAGMTYKGIPSEAVPKLDDLTWFAAALDGLAATPVFFSIGATAPDICAFLNDKLHQPRSVLTGLRETLDVSLHRLIGRACLGLDAVRDLGVGDFVVLEDAAADTLAIRCEDNAFYFETAQDGWLCTAIHKFENFRKMPPMDDPESGPQEPLNETSQDPEAADMAELVSTVLTVECGAVRMTLAELETFQTGAIIPLPDQLTQNGLQVTIRAGDRQIAKGDIVQIDDRIAVRISDLLTRTS